MADQKQPSDGERYHQTLLEIQELEIKITQLRTIAEIKTLREAALRDVHPQSAERLLQLERILEVPAKQIIDQTRQARKKKIEQDDHLYKLLAGSAPIFTIALLLTVAINIVVEKLFSLSSLLIPIYLLEGLLVLVVLVVKNSLESSAKAKLDKLKQEFKDLNERIL
jgi:hypothetical protein